MSAPFVWILVFFAAGVICPGLIDFPGWILLPSTFVAIAACRTRNFGVSVAALLFWILLLAAATTQEKELQYRRNGLRIWVQSHEKEVVAIEGTLVRTPELAKEYFVLQLDIDSIAESQIRGTARLTVSGELKGELIRGDRIRTFARLRLPRNFRTEGAFDYEQYLRTQGIHVLGTIKNQKLIHKVAEGRLLNSHFSRLRLKWIRNTIESYPPENAGILRALWLDDRGGLNQSQERILMDAGIFHVIAISGFHISILLLLLFLILKRLISFRSAIAAGCLFLLGYFVLLEGRSSVTRSFLSFLILAFAFWRYEQIRLSNWIALTALVQLVLNPLELYDAGFQLTYLSTFAILFLVVPVCRRFQGLRKIYRYPLNFLATGVIVQLVLIPYQVYVFHRVPVYSVFANIIAVPLSSILIAGSGLLMPIPIIAKFLRFPIQMMLNAFIQAASLTADFGVRILPTPPLSWVAGYYISLFLAVIMARRGLKVLFLCATSFFMLVVLMPRPAPPGGRLQVHFLDVGQGDSILIEYPDGTFDLLDGGGFFNSDALDTGQAILIPYFCKIGVTKLNRVFLSHAHADHMNGLISLMMYIPAQEFYITREPVGEPGYRNFLRTVNRAPKRIARGYKFLQSGVALTVIAPADAAKTSRVRNDDSLVLLLEYQGTRILLTGDVEKNGEEAALPFLPNGIDYLKVPHHGSKTSSSAALLDAIRPRAAFISVGSLNWFGHPDPGVVERYRSRRVMLYRTDLSGTIRLRIGEGRPQILLTTD